MVVPAMATPRPIWAKTGSWRRYIKKNSSRKLLGQNNGGDHGLDHSIDVSERRKNVRFQEEAVVVPTKIKREDSLSSLNSSTSHTSGSFSSCCSSQDEAPLSVDNNELDQSASTLGNSSSDTATTTTEEDKHQREIRKRWYTKPDFEAFEKDRQLTALQYRTLKKKGAPFVERDHSVRGIEELLDMDDSKRQNSLQSATPASFRDEHVRRVLDEQTRQKRGGNNYPNPMLLREIAIKSSREARNKSAARGEADALAGYVSSKRQVVQRQVQGVMHSFSRKMLIEK